MPALSLRRLLLVAAAAGLAAGAAFTVLQQSLLVPAILQAEALEAGAHHDPVGPSRLAFTFVFNCLAGFGYALLLAAGMALRGHHGWHRGLLWGVGGWLCFSLAPAIGLPPELPGAAESALAGRQLWWVVAAAGAAVGLTLVAFGRGWTWRMAGVLLAAMPHLTGVPGAGWHGLPPAGVRFAIGVLAVGVVFWLALGAATGLGLARTRGD